MRSGQHSRVFWENRLAEVEKEGSVVEVARRRGVNERTLAWWCWKLRAERRREEAVEPVPQWLPVVLRGAEPATVVPHDIVVECGGVRLRVMPGTDVAYVASLVEALRAC